ncbi:MAG TPA: cyclase family protein [Methanolinea sp.]|nr:cyclase family protein [Methanolinea sp.]
MGGTGGRSEAVAWHDVTRPLTGRVVVYPGDHVPTMVQEDRGRYILSCLHLSTHSGTHIDAPSHYIRGGAPVDAIPPNQLIGKCRVIDIGGKETEIGAGALAPALSGVERLLVKTWFSREHGFREDYPGLSREAADAVAEAGIGCVGIDSPSIEPYSGDGRVHITLLSQGIAVIELLDLSRVREGDYWMVALPLRLEGLDGSPCRVLLQDNGSW